MRRVVPQMDGVEGCAMDGQGWRGGFCRGWSGGLCHKRSGMKWRAALRIDRGAAEGCGGVEVEPMVER